MDAAAVQSQLAAVLADPAIQRDLEHFIGDLHRVVIGEQTGSVTLAQSDVDRMVTAAAPSIPPDQLAAIPPISFDPPVTPINGLRATGAHWWWLIGLVGVAIVATALALSDDRRSNVRTIGTWLIGLSLIQLLVLWVIPVHVVPAVTDNVWALVVSKVADALNGGLVIGLFVILGIGIVCRFANLFMRDPSRLGPSADPDGRSTSSPGRASTLGAGTIDPPAVISRSAGSRGRPTNGHPTPSRWLRTTTVAKSPSTIIPFAPADRLTIRRAGGRQHGATRDVGVLERVQVHGPSIGVLGPRRRRSRAQPAVERGGVVRRHRRLVVTAEIVDQRHPPDRERGVVEQPEHRHDVLGDRGVHHHLTDVGLAVEADVAHREIPQVGVAHGTARMHRASVHATPDPSVDQVDSGGERRQPGRRCHRTRRRSRSAPWPTRSRSTVDDALGGTCGTPSLEG